MKIHIYYFSGTGNSLHVARELEKQLSNVILIPMIQYLNKEKRETEADAIGFVFPVYLNDVPAHLRSFFSHFSPVSSSYHFAVVTHLGYANPNIIQIYLQRVLKKKGKQLNAMFDVKMGSNSPTGLLPTWMKIDQNWASSITKDKISSLERGVEKKIQLIQKVISKQRNHKNSIGFIDHVKERIFTQLSKSTKRSIPFLVDETCNSCGICEQVCPSSKVKLENGKPVWQKDMQCFYCYACFNFCPNQSILVQHYQKKEGRYTHPAISATDIIGQKNE